MRWRAVERRVAELIQRDGEVTIASLRDDLGTSRNYAQALLEHSTPARITLRVGDARVLRRRASRASRTARAAARYLRRSEVATPPH